MKKFNDILKESDIINEVHENVIAKQLGLEFNSKYKDMHSRPGFEITKEGDSVKIEILSKNLMASAMGAAKVRLDKINKKTAVPFEIKKTKNGYILK